jgi:hypothetical protein
MEAKFFSLQCKKGFLLVLHLKQNENEMKQKQNEKEVKTSERKRIK